MWACIYWNWRAIFFGGVTSYSPVEVHQYFERTYSFHLHYQKVRQSNNKQSFLKERAWHILHRHVSQIDSHLFKRRKGGWLPCALHPCFLLFAWLTLHSQDWDSSFLCNVSKVLPNCVASHPRRQYPSSGTYLFQPMSSRLTEIDCWILYAKAVATNEKKCSCLVHSTDVCCSVLDMTCHPHSVSDCFILRKPFPLL
jgi:hypothetical protein